MPNQLAIPVDTPLGRVVIQALWDTDHKDLFEALAHEEMGQFGVYIAKVAPGKMSLDKDEPKSAAYADVFKGLLQQRLFGELSGELARTRVEYIALDQKRFELISDYKPPYGPATDRYLASLDKDISALQERMKVLDAAKKILSAWNYVNIKPTEVGFTIIN